MHIRKERYWLITFNKTQFRWHLQKINVQRIDADKGRRKKLYLYVFLVRWFINYFLQLIIIWCCMYWTFVLYRWPWSWPSHDHNILVCHVIRAFMDSHNHCYTWNHFLREYIFNVKRNINHSNWNFRGMTHKHKKYAFRN